MHDLLLAWNIEKTYAHEGGTVHALRNVSLSVRKGEVIFIVGPSGAGKSTLLHILGGMDTPDKGEVALAGTNLYKASESVRSQLRNTRIGFVFQFYNLIQELTALENVMLPAWMRARDNRTKIRSRALSLLKRMGINKRQDHRPAELSGGERQRVALARALINSPDILFCDEPTGNLDSYNGKLIYDILYQCNRENGLTAVVVTHQESFVTHADKCMRIKDGILDIRVV